MFAERMERRFTMLMVCAVWIHVAHNMPIWWVFGVIIVAGLWSVVTIWHERKEEVSR